MDELIQGDNMFYMEKDGEIIAKITFKQLDDSTIDVNHTFVIKELRSHGIADKLFDKIIKYARTNNQKIVPSCVYVKLKMEQDYDKYADLFAN